MDDGENFVGFMFYGNDNALDGAREHLCVTIDALTKATGQECIRR